MGGDLTEIPLVRQAVYCILSFQQRAYVHHFLLFQELRLTIDHAVACGSGGERVFRHNAIRDFLFTTCTQACMGPTREDRALIPGTEARPLSPWVDWGKRHCPGYHSD